jgi:NAD(P)-dependent dehydrogenase (short-subunit alcohol dehydrogenase family)
MANILAATFGATSTTDDVLSGVNLKGKRILVTGVSAGLGVETARSLVARSAQVVGAARDLNKATAARKPECCPYGMAKINSDEHRREPTAGRRRMCAWLHRHHRLFNRKRAALAGGDAGTIG